MDRPEPQRSDSDAPNGQDYNFLPLTGRNPIRLLHLEPDPVTKALRYTLKAADLDSEPRPVYNCLSYTWAYPQWDKLSATPIDITHAGDRKQKMKCDGRTIKITDNLESALSRLWNDMASIDGHTQKRTPMWIDAICIHQESNNERNAQVAKMDEIYRHAQKVIVWLGPEDEDYTGPAIDVLERLSAVPEEKRNANIPSGLIHREIYTKLGIRPIDTDDWLALGEILMRTWFSRMWVIQELFEAREVVVYCGKHVLEWKRIVDASELLRVTGLGRSLMKYLDEVTTPVEVEEEEEEEEEENKEEDEDDNNSQGNKEESVNEDVDRAVYVSNTVNNQWLFESLREQKEGLKLETLLTYARYFGATGHSDYVYAVRGMWKPVPQEHQRLRETIKPDYDSPVEDVFTAAAYASLVEMGDLNILCLVEDNSLRKARERQEKVAREKEKDLTRKEKIKSKELPSWVPDWSITPIAETLFMNPRPEKGSERWTASKGLPYTSPPEPINRRLSAKGICISTIAKKAAREPEFLASIDLRLDGMEIFALLELLADLLKHYSTSSDLIDAFWTTIIKDTYCEEKADEAARKALTSFLAARIFEVEQALLEDESPADDSPLKHIELLLNNISAKDKTGTIPTYQAIHQIIEKEKADVKFAGVNEEEKTFAESFRSAYLGRRLFCTAEEESMSALLGIGPESLKVGDEVWIIAGANVPMVLRPKGEEKWSLVGECYVRGIMEGEAVSGASRGGNVLDKLLDVVLV